MAPGRCRSGSGGSSSFRSSSSSSSSSKSSRFASFFGIKPRTPSQRQDDLVSSYPGFTRVVRRPNIMEEADDSPYCQFPDPECDQLIKAFYEAARIHGKDCESCPTKQYMIRKYCGIEVDYPADSKNGST